jgi:hypothetical protein
VVIAAVALVAGVVVAAVVVRGRRGHRVY